MTSVKKEKNNNSSRPRLVFLTQFYDPEPIYKGQEFAEALGNLGYDVEVVTGFPNYPGGKIYEGFRIRPIQKSKKNGISITRLPLYPSHDENRLGRVLNYCSFFFSVFVYLSFFARRASLIYVYNPPLTVGLAAATSRIFRKIPVVIDIHDLWPDTLSASGMISNSFILKLIGAAAQWMYKRVQFIILHTHGFKRKLLELGVPPQKMQTIIGWTKEYPHGQLSNDITSDLVKLPGLKVLYAGNIGPAQSMEAVINTAYMLQNSGKSDLVTFCFLGGGVGKDKLIKKTNSMKLENVVFFQRVSSDEVGAYLAAADVLFLHLRSDPLFEITLPSKIQAYMYAGKPILAAIKGEGKRLIELADSGISASPEEPDSILQAINSFLKMTEEDRRAMGERGYNFYKQELSMEKGIKEFHDIFSKLINVSEEQS